MAKKKPPAEVTGFFHVAMPEEVRDFFRKQGAKGGKLGGSAGGKKAAAALTPAQRVARAKKAVAAREAKRKVQGS